MHRVHVEIGTFRLEQPARHVVLAQHRAQRAGRPAVYPAHIRRQHLQRGGEGVQRRELVLARDIERAALMQQAARLMVAYMPYKVHVHRIVTSLTQPWVHGYRAQTFVRDFWKYVDVDAALQRGSGGPGL